MSQASDQPESRLPTERLAVPLHGADNPSSRRQGTSPGSFALSPDVGGPLTFASPDTPGMPSPSEKTAWDFRPTEGAAGTTPTDAVTQLERARLGEITPEMTRVAAREQPQSHGKLARPGRRARRLGQGSYGRDLVVAR